jgi:hypothetical protein
VFLFQAKFHNVVTKKKNPVAKCTKGNILGGEKNTNYTPYFEVKKKSELGIFRQ